MDRRSPGDARARFEALADHILARLRPGEDATVRFQAEDSSFIRFNHAKVRQSGDVDQRVLTLRLIADGRQAAAERTLTGDADRDAAALDAMLTTLRARIPGLPVDPQLQLAPPSTSCIERPSRLPEAASIVDEVLTAAEGLDLVGILAVGPIQAGLVSSQGHRHWYEASSFNLDWCLYHGGGGSSLAVKSGYAGDRWESGAFHTKLATGRQRLGLLGRAPVVLTPGTYRTWFEPAAMAELLRLVNGWEGFSLRAARTQTSPLIQLHQGRQRFAASVHIAEDAENGVAPRFDDEGFLCPDRVSLVDGGVAGSLLVSSRSAKEYGVPGTGVGSDEVAASIALRGGELADSEVLARLGTGIFVSNLWYLNWSDRNAARATGMTRFATFWVENGELVAPIAAMRLDDTLYRLWGPELEALGASPETMLSADTYFRRSTESISTPGALVRGAVYTL